MNAPVTAEQATTLIFGSTCDITAGDGEFEEVVLREVPTEKLEQKWAALNRTIKPFRRRLDQHRAA